ncbi:MAG: hypothetical protein OJF58_001158 [Enhydrobacter sp.]|nr:MAG: hypothetical protein OJF58_001158 [Enhydrobacter sp.]
MKRPGLALVLFTVAVLAGCANCQSCRQIPGWDGRYANYYRGPTGEGGLGLPITPYVPR